MANLKEIRVRISSVTTTRQITSAMKMVSAAKLKKAQDSIIQLRPYAQKLNEILVNIVVVWMQVTKISTGKKLRLIMF
jgi:F-type H+-transporting ATPase subunit gamma